MDKSQIDENKYIELVNNKMKEHELYEDGMKIELHPDYSNKPSGYNIVGGLNAKSIAAWATEYIKSKYELNLSN